MKAVILVLSGLLMTSNVWARPMSGLEKALRQDTVIRGTILAAKKEGETCEFRNVEQNPKTGAFKASLDCDWSGDEFVGGGIVLMLNIQGIYQNDFLNDYKIEVFHAG